ncbi:Ras family protein [Tritrichomonas foetus]|uniref:Ras family protein n=1 Tax=Tritrichomonas foetus TaxID=1144522 RepID=A0A1J4JVE2_9EUKA|nr:Ras family protein [Tritrichomonas foetus]|eukprot:OHT01494.1 Ras family protein [Tritrichomonas foetus]
MTNLCFKFLLIGDGAVGKTSLVRRLCQDEFDQDVETTIGVEFLTKTLTINDSEVKLQIWDTAGHERYRSVGKAYYRNAIGVLLVFSLCSKRSFTSLDMWMSEAKKYCHPRAKIILVGNKVDLINDREVTLAEAETYAKSNGMQYIESSAKENTNVLESFLMVTQDVHRAVITNEIQLMQPIGPAIEEENEDKPKKKCC